MLGNTPFQKRILLLCWILRFALLLVLIGIYAWALSYVVDLSDDDVDGPTGTPSSDHPLQTKQQAAIGFVSALLALLVVCAILDALTIIMLSRRRLPAVVFAVNLLQTLFWLAMLILSAVGTAASHNAGVVVNLIMFLLYLGPLVYTFVVYRRDQKGNYGGRYQQAPNSDSFGMKPHDFQHEPDNAESAYRQSYGQGLASQHYSDVPQPRAEYDRNSPQQHQSYVGQQRLEERENAGYELPETAARYH